MPLPRRPGVTLEIGDRPLCAGGTLVKLGSILTKGMPSLRIALDHNEWLKCTVPIEDEGYALIRRGRVLRFIRDHSTNELYEGRISSVRVTSSTRTAEITARAVLNADLLDSGPLYIESGGIRSYKFTAAKTITQWITDIIVPRLTAHLGYTSYAVAGTVDYTDTFEREVDHESAIQLLDWLAGEVRGEWYARRNGVTDYRIDMRVVYGGAASGRAMEGRNIVEAILNGDDARQATALLVEDSRPRSVLRWNQWRVAAVTSGVLELGDPSQAVGAYPIPLDDHYNAAYLWNPKNGQTLDVEDSVAGATQEVDVSSGAYEPAVGDALGFVADAGVSHWYMPRRDRSIVICTAIGGAGGNVLTLADHGHGSDPVPAEWAGQIVGARIRGASLIRATTASGISSWVLTCGSTTDVQAGDICIINASATTSYTPQRGWFRVVSVDSGTTCTLEGYDEYGKDASSDFSASWAVRFYRKRGTSTVVVSADASGNTVTVPTGALGGISTNDLIMVEVDLEHARVSELLRHAPAEALYPVPIEKVYRDATVVGLSNAMWSVNPSYRTWSDSGQYPTGWAGQSSIAKTREDASSVGGLFGPYVWKALANSGEARSDLRFLPFKRTAQAKVAVAIRWKTNGANWTGDAYLEFGLRGASYSPAAGAVNAPIMRVRPPGGSATNTSADMAADTWTVHSFIFDLNAAIGNSTTNAGARSQPWGLFWRPSGTSGTFNTYVDIMCVTVMEDGLPHAAVEELAEFDPGSVLASRAAKRLVTFGYLPVAYELKLADLFRVDPDNNSDLQLSLGNTVALAMPTLNLTDALRVVAIEPNFENEAETGLTLHTQADTLSRLLGGV